MRIQFLIKELFFHLSEILSEKFTFFLRVLKKKQAHLSK